VNENFIAHCHIGIRTDTEPIDMRDKDKTKQSMISAVALESVHIRSQSI